MNHPVPSYDELQKPLSPLSAKGLYYGALRLLLRGLGPLSNAIRLGLEHGFDSGVMLEYVYRNEPSGIFGIGKLIDAAYLNAPGWRGIRERRKLVKAAIQGVLSEQQQAGLNSVLLDVACGGGRYIFEALREGGWTDVSVRLRDYQQVNVDKAGELAREFGLNATLERADAFSDADLATIRPHPTLIVVSGLHEILPDDELIRNHFHQLYDLLEFGGALVFTIQPNHPQVELIARTLKSHMGGLWVMRLRSWDLTRSWAEAAGFSDFDLSMEPQGIFGVVTARKV